MNQRGAWYRKFAVACSGIVWAVRTQNSFWVHLSVAAVVLTLGAWLRLEPWRWAAIVLTTTAVLYAEMINTSIEQLVKAVHPEHDDRIGRALDIAAGAVLLAAVASVTVGLITLGPPLWARLSGPH